MNANTRKFKKIKNAFIRVHLRSFAENLMSYRFKEKKIE